MKNKDILLDVIGGVDEDLVPDLTEKNQKSGIAKLAALGGVCAAAVIGCVLLLPRGTEHSALPPSDSLSAPSAPSAPTADENAYCLALADYPEIPSYPDETDRDAMTKWSSAVKALRDQPKGYTDGFDTFFANSTRTFLSDSGRENVVYSPLSLYMALGISAEISGGNTRQQILDALCQSDIDTLRANSKAVWQANYMDDGMAKCVLAASLWINDSLDCNADTIGSAADNYYSSVYRGDPSDDNYNAAMQNWMNNAADGLLSDYVRNIKMDPEMVLTLASTVNYSGKWREQFDKELTEQGIFRSPQGEIRCEFMNTQTNTSYFWGERFGSVSMQLENNGEMRLILPDEGVSPEELINDDELLAYLTNTGDYANSKFVTVDLSLPKFDVSSDIDLKDGLNKLGIKDIFDPTAADLTPLCDDLDGISLSKAEQDTRVMIDEEGCRAASLTVMQYNGAAMPEDYIDLVFDRPFIFEIMSETGLPLFVGIVNSPD